MYHFVSKLNWYFPLSTLKLLKPCAEVEKISKGKMALQANIRSNKACRNFHVFEILALKRYLVRPFQQLHYIPIRSMTYLFWYWKKIPVWFIFNSKNHFLIEPGKIFMDSLFCRAEFTVSAFLSLLYSKDHFPFVIS